MNTTRILKETMNMLPFKKILCPTDFSEPSYEALERANELALHFSAELTVVHVINPIHVIPTPGDPRYFASYEQNMKALARERLDEVVTLKVPKGVKSCALVAHGSPAEEIVRIAADEDADIIVIGSHGLTGWRHIVFGSVAERVVRLAPCAVLTIRAPKKEVATAYHERMEAQLEEFADKIHELKSKYEATTAETREKYRKRMEELLAKHETANQKLDDLKTVADDEWETVKAGWEEIRKDLRDTLNHLISSF